MIIAQRFAATLTELGVRRAYGLPGEDHMTLLDALAAAGIEYYTAVNESSSVIMAATDAKVSGVPGVAILSLAPGISNGLNGLLHSYMEGAPVLVISGQHAANRQPFVVRQGFELDKLISPVTKWAGQISATADPVMAICKALDLATAYRPGPVYLELPDEVAKAEEPRRATNQDPIEVLRSSWNDRGLTRMQGSPPTQHAVSTLREHLERAKHPALIIGGRRQDVSAETAEDFSQEFRCPVFTSSGQKGLVTSSNPFYAGTFLNGSLESRILSECDLLLMVNPEAYDVYNTPWRYDTFAVSITPAPLEEWLYSYSSRVVANPDTTLRALLGQVIPASEWTAHDVRQYRSYVRDSLLEGDESIFSVPMAVDVALSASPPAVRLVADAGFSKPIVAMLSEPTTWGNYLASNALSTMGFSIPAAIAAARASDRPVLAFLGDGSLLMRATELVMAKELKARLVIVAIMDESLSQIEIKQERLNLNNVGVTLPHLSCAQLGEALDIDGVDVDDTDSLTLAVNQGWSASRPTLIGAHVSAQSSRGIYEVLRG